MNLHIYQRQVADVQDALRRLCSTVTALQTTNPTRYAANLQELSLDAAYQAEALACKMRHIIFQSEIKHRHEYLCHACDRTQVTVKAAPDRLTVVLPNLIPNRKRSASREYLTGLVYAAMSEASRQYPLPQFQECVLCIVHCFDVSWKSRPMPDYDNIELKTVQDILALFTMVDDSMRYCDRYESIRPDHKSHTEFHIIPKEEFGAWLEEQNRTKSRVENEVQKPL